MFTPSKLLGDRLATIAQSVGSLNAPTKLTDLGGMAGTGYDPGASSFTPAKITNFTPAAGPSTDPFNAVSGTGAPMKLGASTLLGMFPGSQNATPAVATPVGTGASMGGEWAGVDQWNAQIAAAAAKYGVPQNLIKAVMKLESNGDPNAAGADGVWGPMQVNANAWGDGPWMHDAAANIDKGAQILADAYKNNGNDWTMALRAYHGFGSDGYTTDQQYADIVNGNWSTLNNVQQSGGGATTGGGSTSAMSSIWGGGDAPITQPFGHTDFSDNSAYGQSAYEYTRAYTPDHSLVGHGGVDVGVGYGTALRSPGTGVVKIAGGSGYFCDSDQGKDCGAGGSGELRIEFANGDQVILGHMGSINVQVGQTVQAGQVVGTSGGENGAHVHVEYRKYTPGLTDSGYELVDPTQALGGAMPASGATAITTPGVAPAGSFAQSLAQFAQQWGH